MSMLLIQKVRIEQRRTTGFGSLKVTSDLDKNDVNAGTRTKALWE